MFQKQKDTILSLLKADDQSKDFHRYLLPYKDFFDIEDGFAEFQCERYEGKAPYISLAEQLTDRDENAQIFVELYGIEDDDDAPYIYAETLVIISALSFSEIESILTRPKDIFPSDIGQIKEFTEKDIVIDQDGKKHFMTEFYTGHDNFYYCWWD